MTTTTLNAIRAESPCKDGWEKLLKSLGKTEADYEPLELETILASNGIVDAVWCLHALPEEYHPRIRLFACDLAEHVLKIWVNTYPEDNRPAEAIRVSRAYARGEATREELEAAKRAAAAAAAAAAEDSVWAARRGAARRASVWAAALSAGTASVLAALSTTSAAGVAKAASGCARGAAARASVGTELKFQKKLFIKYFGKDNNHV